TPTASNRLAIVPVLSSAARIPLPGATSARAVASRSATTELSPGGAGPQAAPPGGRLEAQRPCGRAALGARLVDRLQPDDPLAVVDAEPRDRPPATGEHAAPPDVDPVLPRV